MGYGKKFDDAVARAIEAYEKTRKEKDGLVEITAAIRSGEIELGYLDAATDALREGIKEISESDDFLDDDDWGVISRKTFEEELFEQVTETDIKHSPGGAIDPIAEETAL